jgi:hypothetical protein
VGAPAQRGRPRQRQVRRAVAVTMGGTHKPPGIAVPRDRELEAGTSAHYEEPAYYTVAYRRRVDDVRYL